MIQQPVPRNGLSLSEGEPDAIVVGGGPAGAAFALELARNGRRVMLLERTLSAHHKVCGEFLSRETQHALAAFGIDTAALGATCITDFRLVKGARQATTRLPFNAAGLSRLRLDEALVGAAEAAGGEVVRGARVTKLVPADGGVIVETEARKWRAPVVALATGKHSLRGLTRPHGSMVGFKLHLDSNAAARALGGVVQLAFFPGGYMGACLVEDQTLSIGWVMEDDLLRSVGADWPAQSEYLARQSSLIGDLLAGARPQFAKPVATAAIPYGFLRKTPIAPSLYPIGDQLAVVPSFTGDGMAIALTSGVAAARAVVDRKPAEMFQREFIARLKPQFRVAGALGRLLQMPATCAIAVAAARILPALAAKMVAATRLKGFEISPAANNFVTAVNYRERYGNISQVH
jgi:flavin-dependent dehydrogenase